MREGLCEIFHDISPIKDFTGNLELSFEGFTLGEPKYTVEECKERDASYSAPLNVNVRLLYKDTGEIKESKVFMGDFPLMNGNRYFCNQRCRTCNRQPAGTFPGRLLRCYDGPQRQKNVWYNSHS